MRIDLEPYLDGRKVPLAGHRFEHILNLILLESVSSTNDVARVFVEHALEEGDEVAPTAVIAGGQSAGRGRHGRVWLTPESGLAVSLVVPWPEGPERIRLPIQFGIALARGLSATYGIEVKLKWPNDLVVNGRKLGGLLVEARAGDDGEGFAIVGIGLNLTTTREELDAAGLDGATSLGIEGVNAALLEGERPLFDLLTTLDQAVGSPVEEIPEAFESVSLHRAGDRLSVLNGDAKVEGLYVGVTEDGLLRLDTGQGIETVVSGDVATF